MKIKLKGNDTKSIIKEIENFYKDKSRDDLGKEATINIKCGTDMLAYELIYIAELLEKHYDDDTNVKVNISCDEEMKDRKEITITSKE